MTTTMAALGAVLVVAGGMLALRCGLLLAGRGRPRRGPRPAFVIAGPYRRTRNPLCAGILIALAGLAVAMRSATLALATALAAAATHAWIVGVEERRLAARFGDAYAAYLRSVPRWFPGRSRAAAR